MKKSSDKFYVLVAFILWLACTIILVLTIIGMFIMAPPSSSYSGRNRATWMQIGYDLVQRLIEPNYEPEGFIVKQTL